MNGEKLERLAKKRMTTYWAKIHLHEVERDMMVEKASYYDLLCDYDVLEEKAVNHVEKMSLPAKHEFTEGEFEVMNRIVERYAALDKKYARLENACRYSTWAKIENGTNGSNDTK